MPNAPQSLKGSSTRHGARLLDPDEVRALRAQDEHGDEEDEEEDEDYEEDEAS